MRFLKTGVLVLITISIIFYIHINEIVFESNIISPSKYFQRFITSNDIMDLNFDIDSLKSKSIFDETSTYKLMAYVYTGSEWNNLTKYPLCIAEQCTTDRMHYLPDVMKSWPGPLSVAIFSPGIELPIALHYINYLVNCYPSIRRRVSFHMIIMSKEDDYEPLNFNNLTRNCEDKPQDFLEKLLSLRNNKTLEWRGNILFPVNVARNVARETCQSPWLSNLDIDMVLPRPTRDIQPSEQLMQFLQSETADKCDKCAFVLPIFEIASNVTELPSCKAELITLVDKQLARTFYSTIYGPSHSPSEQESKWLKLPKSEGIKVVYQPTYELKYEPLYIAKRGTPNFDERYLQNGMDRDSQTYELYLAGYTYHMLDNIFLAHLGFKLPEHYSENYMIITSNNVNMFQELAQRQLAAKYDKDPLNLLKEYAENDERYTVKIRLG